MLRFMKAPQARDWTGRYVLAFCVLALFWAGEHFVLQASVFEVRPVTTHPGTYQSIRLGIDLMAAIALLLTLSRPFLILVMSLDCLLSLIIVAYNHYFHHALSIYYGLKTFHEGLKVLPVVVEIIPWVVWALLIAGLVIKLALVFEITPQPAGFRRRWAALCVLTAVGFIYSLQYTSFYFRNIPITRVTRAVYVYGYLNSWLAEFFVSPDTREVTRELIELQRDVPDRISATEPFWPFTNNVVIVQMESLGWNVIDYRIDGQEVTPFLNSLAHRDRFFKVQVYHSIGSEDMDYAVLSGGKPSMRMASYLAPGIPYTNALPRFMQQHGFETLSVHGANGDFFNRRPNFERMGFDQIWFQEEFNCRLVKQGLPVRESYWGVRDDELFRVSTEKMRHATRPQFHFIITLDSHMPFDLITDSEKEVFPHSRSWQENYFNSVRLLDRDLREYVEGLPAGTLVILYGDHPSGVNYRDFHAARTVAGEYVPCIVHVQGGAMAQPQVAAQVPEDLRIHDVINCLRRQVALAGPILTASNACQPTASR